MQSERLMQSLCFPIYLLSDDRCRLLTGYELTDFTLRFCALAGANRREPGVIAAAPRKVQAKKLGISEDRFLKRLDKLTSPGIELIELHSDGSILVVDFAAWNGLEEKGGLEQRSGPVDRRAEDRGEVDRRNGANSATSTNGSVGRTKGADRQANFRERERQKAALQRHLDQIAAEQAEEDGNAQNSNSNAFDAKSNASASRNGNQSVTSPSQSVTLNASESLHNGTLEALRPSRAGDDNDQRYGLDLDSKNSNTDSETLIVTNVGNAPGVTPSSPQSVTLPRLSSANTSQSAKSPPPNLRGKSLAAQSVALCLELRDRGSEARHYQLLAVCEENNLPDLPSQALNETRRRMNNRGRSEVEKPGAYYTTALLRRLGERGVHVPTKAELEAEPASEVQRLIQESIQATLPASYTPLEEPPEFDSSPYREEND